MAIQPKTQTVKPEHLAACFKLSKYPVSDFNATMITQPFGVNWVGFYSAIGMLGHNGVDIRCKTGTPVYAVFDATIEEVSHEVGGGNKLEYSSLGNTIPGYEGSYRLRAVNYHLLKSIVNVGQKVKAGDIVAYSDNTGTLTTGPHLHLGLKIDKKTTDGWECIDKDNGFGGCVDPETFFPDRRYEILPVDYRYGLPMTATGEAYKASIRPWLRSKIGRWPMDRELNAYAYGKWPFEFKLLTGERIQPIQDDLRFTQWTTRTWNDAKTFYYPVPRPGIND